MNTVEHVPVADETVASKEAGPGPAVKIGVPGGFTEISKPVRRNTAQHPASSTARAHSAAKPSSVCLAAILCRTTRTASSLTLPVICVRRVSLRVERQCIIDFCLVCLCR